MESNEFAVQLQWVGDMASPPSPVNQILITADAPVSGHPVPDAHILSFGFVSPPAIPGELSPSQIAQLQSQPLPVIPAGRFFITTDRLREFRDVISGHLARLEGQG
ncbi:hypothetical protein ACIGCK_04685 [Microbacterium sp. NPDC078428]|uniref:hypothetical protein n=1 Tax=Microbacterium sp. NPDC078428 TaxID=3364190 RepID=UPI0037C75787